jgi:hypothetical protein
MIANRAYLGEARAGGLVKPGAHPALVHEKTWRDANRKGLTFGSLADRKGGPLLGRGLLRCGTCGGGLVRSTGKNRQGHRYEYYRCVTPTCEAKAVISAPRIEHYLIEEALKRLEREALPRDPAAARMWLRNTLGSVTVQPARHTAQQRRFRRALTPADRVEVNWPHERETRCVGGTD